MEPAINLDYHQRLQNIFLNFIAITGKPSIGN